MADEKLLEIQSDYYGYKRKAAIGICITIFAVIYFFANFYFHLGDREYLIGIVIGAGGLYCFSSLDKCNSALSRLNIYCINKYGKPYRESVEQFVRDAYK